MQEILNVAGRALTTDLLQHYAVTDERWEYAGQTYYRKAALARQTPRVLALPESPVCVVATGVDGTTLPLVEENYKEARCGTLALYDRQGTRPATEYHATMPQAGKADFTAEMAERTQALRAQFPQALHVCLGDGAQWNWEFFRRYFPAALCILDFYHAALHLHTAAELIFGAGVAAESYYEKWRERLLEKRGAVRACYIRCGITCATRS